MSLQLPLAVSLASQKSLQNFVSGDNAELLERLTQMLDSEHSEGVLYLWGESGSGKSHLLQALAHDYRGGQAIYLSGQELLHMEPQVLEGLESMGLVCIDELEALLGQRDWEEALFDLYNRLFDAGVHLVVAAQQNYQALDFKLEDLRSRLSWGFTFQLHGLDDVAMVQLMQTRARDLGWQLDDAVAQFILKRCPRDADSVSRLVEFLDQASLQSKRKVSIPMVRQWLDIR